MAEIGVTTIGTNRYAPEGAANIESYSYNGAKGLTLAQLVMAVCFRRTAQIEAAAVNHMNLLSRGADKLTLLSEDAQFVLNGTQPAGRSLTWDGVKAELERMGATGLPATINTYSDRMSAYSQVEALLTTCSADNDMLAIELQTSVNHRDNYYNQSSNTVVTLGKSSLACAAKLN